jgi:vancomycin resistance protein VanJ
MRAESPQSTGPLKAELADDEPQRRRSACGLLLAAASLTLCVAVGVAYFTRADAIAAVTVCPPWAWAIAGVGIACLAAICRAGRKLIAVTFLVWGAYLLATADVPAALFRIAPASVVNAEQLERPGRWNVRVVSLNCGLGNVQAVREVKSLRPQVVLLQESPSAAAIGELARELFGDEGAVVRGADATIIVHGEVKSEEAPTAHSVAAQIRLKNGAELAVVSLRLEPALVRLDFWSPDCWRTQAENRRVRRRQLGEVIKSIADVPASTPLVIGGDFNAPAGDAVYRLLHPRLRDAFVEAGMGWGNTITNDFPFARIDQMWIDRRWLAVSVQAMRSGHSDHRLVVADLQLIAP